MKLSNNPRDYGVPHDEWRPSQRALIEKIMSTNDEYVFGEACVGVGKSSVVTALGHYDHVTVCVHTLALLTQYEQRYGFEVIRGRQEYPCAHKEKIRSWKDLYNLVPLASDCTVRQPWMCKYYSQCPYYIAKHIAFLARRSACTYRYMALSIKMKEREGMLVFDEAHDAAEELIRFNQAEIPHRVLDRFGLPKFPVAECEGEVITPEIGDQIRQWADRCYSYLFIRDDDDSPKAVRMVKMTLRLSQLADISSNPSFIEVDGNSIRIMALSADKIARAIFESKSRAVFMSGTIGDPRPLANALGIDRYASYSFPHPIPIEYRPIDNLNLPRMIKRVLDVYPENYQLQADKAWEWIEMFPVEWRGLILSTSYKKIGLLHEGIEQHSNGRRLIVQKPGDKVNDVVQRFVNDVRPGDIMIGTVQGMGTGIDLYGDLARWMVIAGTPHVNPTDRYMKARRELDGGITYQRWLTYNAVAQASGRITRGVLDENGDFLRNYIAIADGSALTGMAMKYYPDWFKEAIQ